MRPGISSVNMPASGTRKKSLGELTASELEQTAVWGQALYGTNMSLTCRGLPVVVNGNILADALAQLPKGKRDVILLSLTSWI